MDRIDWRHVEACLDGEGYAVIPGLLAGEPVDALTSWAAAFYRHLAPLANRWHAALDSDVRYPATPHRDRKPIFRIVRLREGEDLPLHQSHGGPHAFPFQVVALLSEPGRDFTGGEFVMTERRPRMQSRPMVVPLHAADAAVICATSRPLKGSHAEYRADLKHAVSRVHSGERVGLELLWPSPVNSLR